MQHIFIINPHAGKKDQTGRIYEMADRLRQHGLTCQCLLTQRSGGAEEIARRLVSSGEEVRLYACGGDGTLNEVVIETKAGERRTEKADLVIMAVGSAPASRIVSTTTGIDVDDRGYVLTREKPYGMTTRKGVFAGGDVVNRPSTVVLAMHDAKQVAEGIAQYVDAIKLLEAINMDDELKKTGDNK